MVYQFFRETQSYNFRDFMFQPSNRWVIVRKNGAKVIADVSDLLIRNVSQGTHTAQIVKAEIALPSQELDPISHRTLPQIFDFIVRAHKIYHKPHTNR